jgi:hypothetical protein
MPAEKPVQHLYRVRVPQSTEIGILAASAAAARVLRGLMLREALSRRLQRATVEHDATICPGCGAKPAAVSDLYPEADP